MTVRLRIVPTRRRYNQWVGDETLEDYALRFTAKTARKWTAVRVGNTALGAVSFLALEAIGGAVTLAYGFENALVAILAVSALIFLTGLPIAYYAARDGVDIDLLTRGAGFGYIGSTVTSLIYASFTFIFFAIEAAILAFALQLCFGLPLSIGYVVSAIVVIPVVTHGIAWISRFQVWTQPLWIALHLTPLIFIALQDDGSFAAWTGYEGSTAHGGGFNLLGAGAAGAVVFALVAQIGEQVDILRFMPERRASGRLAWWGALIAAGPGWIVPGAAKMLIGSFLAALAISKGVDPEHAGEPTQMYLAAFGYVTASPQVALALTGAFVMVSQLKINVTNAYAGSIAWSNFFSRLTHAHPGRIVWLFFNVAIAVLLMEAGIYKTLEQTLGLYSVVAVAWVGALVADLTVNKPLSLSPPRIEFKRAHLYDVNPVGVGAMVLATAAAVAAYMGAFGAYAQALSPLVALFVAFTAAPAIAAATRGRFYLARKPRADWRLRQSLTCSVCENAFEPEDMAHCPVYGGPICSLCCSIDARCCDGCKPHARYQAQVVGLMTSILPAPWMARINTRTGHFFGIFSTLAGILGLTLLLVQFLAAKTAPAQADAVAGTLWAVFLILIICAGVAAWLFVLAHESREIAQDETARQTAALMREIEAHKKTDAALQRAKEVAEAANLAKSRYVVGINHELRSPLNAVLGYAQLLDAEDGLSPKAQKGVRVIRRSAEHLAGLLDGLLDIAKVEAGRLKLAREDIWTAGFLEQLVDMFRMQAAAKGVGFVFEGAGALPPAVRGDGKRLRQVLINLLSNAVKFTDAGTVTFRVSYRSQVARFEVIDSGLGIAPEDRARVFEPFERGAAPRAQLQPGMGLGLTITKLLVEIMGGEISMESELAQGSRFRVQLMLGHATGARRPIAAAQRTVAYIGRRRRVLVVDDDADQRSLMRETLEPLGFGVTTANDGSSALDIADDVRPDLVLLDVSMPGMSGYEVARRMRESRPDVRIVMTSANLGDAPAGFGAPPDHDGAISKPVDLQALLATVERLLKLTFVTDDARAALAGDALFAAAPSRPSGRHVEELTRLGEMGFVSAIEAKLAELETADLGSGPFVTAAREKIRAFDMRGYMAMLAPKPERDDV